MIVLLRLGWLTVLSSMNIVEQELYFLDRSPGDICERRRDSLKKKAHDWRDTTHFKHKASL